MITVEGYLVWKILSVSDLLIYIGTLLIGFEFVRKLNKLELMLVLIAAWPIAPIVNRFPKLLRKKPIDWNKHSNKIKPQKMSYSILFIIFLLPVSIISFVLFLLFESLNDFNKILNWLWRKILGRFRPMTKVVAKLTVEKVKRYRGISVREVVDEIQYREIPFLPIVGIILVIISFIMQV